LAPKTAKVYADFRALVPMFVDDQPRYKEIELVKRYLLSNQPHISENERCWM
jgi:histidine ammonia-lyase